MTYNFDQYTTTAQCDEALQVIAVERDKWDYRKESLLLKMENNATSTPEAIQAQIATKQQELTNLNNLLPLVAEGSDRDDLLDRINLVENEIYDLTDELEDNGIKFQHGQTRNMNFYDLTLLTLDGAQAGIEARKAALST